MLKIGSYLSILLLSAGLFGQSNQRQIARSETDAGYGYHEYLPEAYHENADKYPLIIYLHGRGETGNGESDLWKVSDKGPHRLTEEGRDFPAVILSPQSPDSWDVDSLDAFVEWALENYKIDADRLYVTGISMGGGGTWLYASAFPDKPDAIVPISGDARARNPENLVNMPVWAFHNKGDAVVEVELTYEWIEGIRDAGGDPNMTIYEESGHDAWTRTYNDDAMWEWMFAQKAEAEPLQVSEPKVELTIFPNPFSDRLSFHFSGPLHAATLYNMSGQKMTRWTSFERRGIRYTIEVGADILPGIYLVELLSEQEIYRFRVIKE